MPDEPVRCAESAGCLAILSRSVMFTLFFVLFCFLLLLLLLLLFLLLFLFFLFFVLCECFTTLPNLFPEPGLPLSFAGRLCSHRVLRLFGQRLVAWRDSGEIGKKKIFDWLFC